MQDIEVQVVNIEVFVEVQTCTADKVSFDRSIDTVNCMRFEVKLQTEAALEFVVSHLVFRVFPPLRPF